MREFRTLSLLLAAAGCLLAAGCGGQDGPAVVPVSGRLTMNGEPLAGVRIRFFPGESHTQGVTAFADTNEEGGFDITTQKPADGIVPGQYLIDVNMPSPVAEPPPGTKGWDLSAKQVESSDIPEKYRDAKTSELSFNIEGGKPLEIDLK